MSKRWQRYIPALAGALIVVLVGALVIWSVRHFLSSKDEGPKRAVEQKITMIRPTPPPETPPPPPPPPEEKIEQPIEQAEPEQAPQQADAAPAEQLGLDADGAAGADGFGLAARKGGRDLVGTGTAPFKWYTNLIAARLQDCLSQDERIRKGNYKANIKVRIAADGRLDIVDLIGSSGSAEKDAAIRSLKQCNTGESRPLEMPQLATIQVVSRG
ncbi:MAG: TonB C-terminal domain-containing protein [Steroidobacteraceae bacterium]